MLSAAWYAQVLTFTPAGAGNETASHLYENGRITVMFIAFNGMWLARVVAAVELDPEFFS